MPLSKPPQWCSCKGYNCGGKQKNTQHCEHRLKSCHCLQQMPWLEKEFPRASTILKNAEINLNKGILRPLTEGCVYGATVFKPHSACLWFLASEERCPAHLVVHPLRL